MYKAVRTNSHTLIPEVVEVDFEVRQPGYVEGDWIYVTKGGVTGFESAEVKRLVESYLKRSVFGSWIACAGTLNKYDELDIPMSEIIKFLEHQGLIEVKREYGYIKKITWKENQGSTPKETEA